MEKSYRRLLPLGLLMNLVVLPVHSFVISRAINVKVPTKAPVVLRSKSPVAQDDTAATTTADTDAPLAGVLAASLRLKDLEGLNDCRSRTQAERLLEKHLFAADGSKTPLGLYKSISIPPSASVREISDGDLAIQTRLSNKKYKIMDLIEVSGDRDADRASLGLLTVMIGSTMTALTANQNMPGPDILRFLVVLIFTFAPLAFVGYGIATPDKLQTALVVVQREFFPAYRTRMIHHEAGHFLMGHLLGFPVQGYTANAVKNAVEFYPLSDKNRGRERASQLGFDAPRSESRDEPVMMVPEDVPFFSTEGLGGLLLEEQSVFRNAKNYSDNPFLKLASQNEPKNSWPFRGFDHRTVDQLAVVSVAGVCAEILAFGNAEGGVADLGQLRQIFGSAEPKLTDREIENMIRFALGYTMSQLRRHLGALDALVSVMERDGSVAECVLAIESCDNASGQNGIMGGDYELRRKQAIRSKAGNLVEMIFLGGERNADTEKEGLVQGKGGGYQKEKTPFLTGDDPLYVAIAIAFGFFLWASTGGLSLH